MTPSGIEPVTFRFVAQHLNHCATAVPRSQHLPNSILELQLNCSPRAVPFGKESLTFNYEMCLETTALYEHCFYYGGIASFVLGI